MGITGMNIAGGFSKWIYRLLAVGAVGLWPAIVMAGELRNLDVNSLPGDRVEVTLTFDGPPPDIRSYAIEQPARISIDLPATISKVPKYNDVGFSNAQSITVIETKDRTRMIVNLEQPAGYTYFTEDNKLIITVGDGDLPEPVSDGQLARSKDNQQGSQGNDAESKAKVTGSGLMLSHQPEGITSIDFERGEGGEGNIVIGLSSKSVAMDLEEQGGRLRLTFPGARLPASLKNRLDVIDFATPVQYVDARIEEGNAMVIIEPKGEYDYLAWQTDNMLTISVKALSSRQVQRNIREKQLYSGDRLSLNFQDIEVRDVLQILADFKDLNLVASDTVVGRVTLRLKSVPWDQALDIVLRSKGLGQRQENNVLIVAPAVELAALEREQLESEQQIRELAPLYTELMQINYADAKEISTVLVGGEDNRILSERGSVQVIERTNSLLVQETQVKLDEIRNLIEKVDIPVRQVMIEARIVNADTRFVKELGVKWGGYVNPNGPHTQADRQYFLGGQDATVTTSVEDGATERSYTYDQLFTDLSVSGTTRAALAIGLITDSSVINLELSAMEADGGGEVVSQPKVITSDKQKAVIKSGKEIPYQEASSSGATSISFKDAVLSLEVTPQITPDGRVIMDIKITNNDSTTSTSTGVPIIDTNEVQTKVLIDDGQTIVLGGIFKNTTKEGVDKVPLLGDLPGIGRLFRKDTKQETKSEVLIFITPKILTGSLALR